MENAIAWCLAGLLLIGASSAVGRLMKLAWTRHAIEPYAADNVPPPGAYAAEMIELATRDYGYRWLGAARHIDSPELQTTFLLSPDGLTMATITDGKQKKQAIAITTLESRFEDGGSVSTWDIDAPPLDPMIRHVHLLNADFAELVALHTATLAEGPPPVAHDDAFDLAAINKRCVASIERMIACGRARRVDANRYRFGVRGGLRLTLGESWRQFNHPPDTKRIYRRRPGSNAKPTEPIATASIRE